MENKTISKELDEIWQTMCDSYCKYPSMEPPEGKDENWLIEDDESPCNTCPMMRL